MMIEFLKEHLPQKYELATIELVFNRFETLLRLFSDEELENVYTDEFLDINRLNTLGLYWSVALNDIVQVH
jgi:hypothetical protein